MPDGSGTDAMRKLKKEGKLDDQEESDEINACSIVVPVEIDGRQKNGWLTFKNETHNHRRDRTFRWCGNLSWRCNRDPLSGVPMYSGNACDGAA